MATSPSRSRRCIKAPAAQAKREKANVGGIAYRGKGDVGVARQLEEIY